MVQNFVRKTRSEKSFRRSALTFYDNIKEILKKEKGVTKYGEFVWLKIGAGEVRFQGKEFFDSLNNYKFFFLTVHLSISLDNDQLDAHLLYFTIRPLQSSTCFEHYMLIIRRLNCIDAASGIVLSVSGRPVHRLRGRYQMLHQYNSTS